ncbi:sulfotransferase family 2 domain-containing protein [Marixanthomonas spongiae]|uniref:Sulfotransferase family protein n=1 Tax=Marixanthomonas spongiae TaxID=2174845 RepID=A0A2U0I3S4_9FLAO|nr:sulfotransferase family 2 domain-containing protein [Marixanthomonas spongiae]PVW15762.1 hypothetical protein DDV96_05700 [Marixanthomonas spongiae]
MLIPEHKALFVHIPKTAGQSVENFMLKHLGKNREKDGPGYLLRYNPNPEKGPKRLAHLTAKEYVKYGYLNQEQFETYFKFTIVRNPWERMLSFYKFRGFSSLIGFNTFINRYLPEYFEKEHGFFKPQTDFIFNTQNELLVDFMGRFEQLNADFSIIADHLSIPFSQLPKHNRSIEKGIVSKKSFLLLQKHPKILKHLNFSPQKTLPYQQAYTDASRKLVNRLYERDIDLLGYVF